MGELIAFDPTRINWVLAIVMSAIFAGTFFELDKLFRG